MGQLIEPEKSMTRASCFSLYSNTPSHMKKNVPTAPTGAASEKIRSCCVTVRLLAPEDIMNELSPNAAGAANNRIKCQISSRVTPYMRMAV